MKKLSKKDLWKAHQLGKVIEVNCPWWGKNNWQIKKPTSEDSFWDEANYRIKNNDSTRKTN